MKKNLLLIGGFCAFTFSGYAQKYALIDMEYILKKIPAYENSNKQLETASKQWQKDIEVKASEVQNLYKKYQAEQSKLSATEKGKREQEIVMKEKAIQDLRNKYFGPEGELAKRRQTMIMPIQNSIYNAVKEISGQYNIQMVIDRASANSVIFATPEIDISDAVLSKLGY